MNERQFNDNITLIYFGQRPLLQDNEYYALMVTSQKHGIRDQRVFFDESEGWLGLERTGERIYISKETRHSNNKGRGEAMVVRVENPGLCCVLNA